MSRLLLVRHAATAATERRAFGTDEALSTAGRRAAAQLSPYLPAAATVLSSTAKRCRETASATGLRVDALDADLQECNFGSWTGLTFAEIGERDPAGLASWLHDPDAAPHDGESLHQFSDRIGDWLRATVTSANNTTVAFTHAGVIQAAAVTVMQAPPSSFWTLAVAPASITELVNYDGRWVIERVGWTVPS